MASAGPSLHARLSELADQIAGELQRLGRWSGAPLNPARLVDMGPFGMRTLAPEEWIEAILVPRLRELVETRGAPPPGSQTAAWATRQFDGDPDTSRLVALLHELDDLVDRAAQAGEAAGAVALDEPGRGGGAGHALVEAVARGDLAAVEALLARGADPNAPGGAGIEPLFVAAAGGHRALSTFLIAPFEVELASIDPATAVGDAVAITARLLAHGARVDRQVEPTGLTPLMVATYFGQREIAARLLAHGAPAQAQARDAWGRTAERFAVYPTIARVIRRCRELPMVTAAYVAQIHDPVAHQFTTPVLGLELSAPLPPEALAGWPPDEPLVAFVLGEDAMSRLVRLTRPVYRAS